MGLIPDEQLEQIRESVDIVQLISEFVPLKKAGLNFKGLCPFHTEKTPSFVVNPDKQIFHCFGCGEGGNVYKFMMLFEGQGFVESVQMLAERAGIALQFKAGEDVGKKLQHKKQLARVNRLAAEFYFNQLHKEAAGKTALEYLVARGIDAKTAQKFLVGFAPAGGRLLSRYLESRKVPLQLAEAAGLLRRGQDGSYYDFFRGRLIFPIRNLAGDFIAFGGRVIEEGEAPGAKYINTAETALYQKGREVYGLFEARAPIREAEQVMVVEGYMDVIALAQHGIEYAVAPLGTALTPDQVKRLSRHARELVLIFDGDRAGVKAAWRALEVVTPAEVPTRIISLPAGEDPDSFVRQEGELALRERGVAAPGLMDYFIDKVVAESPADNVGKIQAARKLLPQLARVPQEVEKSLYIQALASKLGIPESAVQQELVARQQRGRNFPQGRADDNDAGRHANLQLNPFERNLLQAILSKGRGCQELLGEIGVDDWQNEGMKKLWPQLRDALLSGSPVADFVVGMEDSPLSRELSALCVAETPEGDENLDDLIQACRLRLQQEHLKLRRQDLTRQIRQAEAQSDRSRLDALLAEQNRLH